MLINLFGSTSIRGIGEVLFAGYLWRIKREFHPSFRYPIVKSFPAPDGLASRAAIRFSRASIVPTIASITAIPTGPPSLNATIDAFLASNLAPVFFDLQFKLFDVHIERAILSLRRHSANRPTKSSDTPAKQPSSHCENTS